MIILFLVSLKITALVDVWKVQYQYILDCLGCRDCDFEQYRVEFTNQGPGIEVVVIRFCRHRAHITHKSETENDNLTKQLSADWQWDNCHLIPIPQYVNPLHVKSHSSWLLGCNKGTVNQPDFLSSYKHRNVISKPNKFSNIFHKSISTFITMKNQEYQG